MKIVGMANRITLPHREILGMAVSVGMAFTGGVKCSVVRGAMVMTPLLNDEEHFEKGPPLDQLFEATRASTEFTTKQGLGENDQPHFNPASAFFALPTGNTSQFLLSADLSMGSIHVGGGPMNFQSHTLTIDGNKVHA